jgi:hypothetical protein
LSKKEAVLLLNNPPTNTEATAYVNGCCKQITHKEARVPALKKSIESWTTGKELGAFKEIAIRKPWTSLNLYYVYCSSFVMQLQTDNL